MYLHSTASPRSIININKYHFCHAHVTFQCSWDIWQAVSMQQYTHSPRHLRLSTVLIQLGGFQESKKKKSEKFECGCWQHFPHAHSTNEPWCFRVEEDSWLHHLPLFLLSLFLTPFLFSNDIIMGIFNKVQCWTNNHKSAIYLLKSNIHYNNLLKCNIGSFMPVFYLEHIFFLYISWFDIHLLAIFILKNPVFSLKNILLT